MTPWIAVSISLLSLLVSGTSAYFNFFWIESSASAAVLNFQEQFDSADGGFEIDVAVYNTGNRQMAVTRIEVIIDDAVLSARLIPREETEKYPVLIEPKELALFRVGVDNFAWEEVVASRQADATGESDFEVPISVEIQAVSSVGAGMRSELDRPVAILVGERDGAFFYGGNDVSRNPEPFEVSDPVTETKTVPAEGPA
jgi:hypothetical protein